jgi:hypothetical protein
MAALAGLDDLIRRATADDAALQRIWWRKTGFIAGAIPSTIAGHLYSQWLSDGDVWQAGAAPAAVTAPTNTTQGALPFTNPSGSLWLAGSAFAPDGRAVLYLYDRLLQCGGLSGTSTSVQNIGGAITRNTGGVGNRIYVEITAALGATARTLTVNYTNQAGASKSITTILGGTNFMEAYRMIPVGLASGDTGVQGVTSVQLDASTGTAGDFAIVIGKVIDTFATAQGSATFHNPLSTPIVEIPSGACIAGYCAIRTANFYPAHTGYLTLLDV